MADPIMAETYQILLIEKDKQVVEDITRYLRASAGVAGFSVEWQEDLLRGRSIVAMSNPDAVLIDAAQIEHNGSYGELKTILTDRGIPVLILSATNGQELRNKAAMAGARDYFLKNKLNYFYLPRAILSAIRSHSRSTSRSHTDNQAHAHLLNRVKEAVMIVDKKGDIVYSNTSAKHLLNNSDAVSLLRKAVNLRDGSGEFKATVEIQNISYDLKVGPQDWAGQQSTGIHISKNIDQPNLVTDEKLKMLGEFIRACSIPFVLLVNDEIREANENFLNLLNTDSRLISGRRLTEFITVNNNGPINLLESPASEIVVSIMGTKVSPSLELLRKTVSVGEQQITICSLATPGQNDHKLLSPHRLMEIASHELREPIRTSVSYLHLLTEGLKKQADEKKMLSYAQTITAEVNRAEQMLADMKTLLNLSDKIIKPGPVNVKNLVQDVLKQLKPMIDASEALVDVAEMPTVLADSNDLKRLLYHLIDNALKFRNGGKHPYLEVLAVRDGHDWRFCVKDNGIGIDSKYHAVIFEPFKKLNRVDEYTGAGNGLCICKHIIEMHGGRIWVESQEGFGSSFFFTLPGA